MSLARGPQRAKASVGSILARFLGTLVFLAIVLGVGWAVLVSNQASGLESVDAAAAATGELVDLNNGQRLHYREVGSGQPVLLIHDFDLGGGHQWLALAESLDGYRLLIPDLVDFGLSARPQRPGRAHTIFGQAENMSLFLDQLELDQVHVIGAGWGGAVAAQLAINNPNRVDQLVLIAPEILGPEGHWTDIAYGWPVLGQALNFTFRGGGSRAQAQFQAECATGGYCPSAEDLSVRQVGSSVAGTSAALTARAATPEATTVPAELSLVSAPTLFIWGQGDAITPLSDGRTLAESMLEASVEVVPAGHHPHRQLPAEVAALIDQFLS